MSYGGFSELPTWPEKLISAGSYLTMGLVGFIWLIIVTLQKGVLKTYLKYHIFQSIFITVLVAIASIVVNILLKFALIVPVVGDIVKIAYVFLTGSFIEGFSILNLIFSILMLYFAITALLGKYSYFPWISDNVRQLISQS
jgi:hypothetical protein